MDMIKARRGASKAQFSGIGSAGGGGASSVNNQKWRMKESARAANYPHGRCNAQELVSAASCNNTGLGVDPAQQKSRHCLLQQLHSKLQSLEQDMNLLKRSVMSCAAERAVLMNEISRLFHGIEDCSVNSNSEAGATSFRLRPISNSRKEEERSRKMGLHEVLLQGEGSSPVTREMKSGSLWSS